MSYHRQQLSTFSLLLVLCLYWGCSTHSSKTSSTRYSSWGSRDDYVQLQNKYASGFLKRSESGTLQRDNHGRLEVDYDNRSSFEKKHFSSQNISKDSFSHTPFTSKQYPETKNYRRQTFYSPKEGHSLSKRSSYRENTAYEQGKINASQEKNFSTKKWSLTRFFQSKKQHSTKEYPTAQSAETDAPVIQKNPTPLSVEDVKRLLQD